ncbi:MAG: methyltransferase domain-containing protein, partial [Alphaproteobacteria bacterium]|nr:methyltransferase domain-containing protein [Alphaproteobacteria bacterium]
GCGTGLNSAAIAAKGHTVCGVDLSAVAISKYRQRGFEGKVANIEEGIDYPDAAFDLVYCSEVIEHLAVPERLAAEAYRVLRQGGLLVLSTPNSAFWLYRLLGLFGYTVSELQHPKHLQFFSKRGLRRLLASAGFRPRDELGRNMYLILPDLPTPLRTVLPALGFKQEIRYRTKRPFWHLSGESRFWCSLFAETLIVVMEKP